MPILYCDTNRNFPSRPPGNLAFVNSTSPLQKFTPNQARSYALNRGALYSREVHEAIFTYHKKHGGRTGPVVDLRDDPGIATRDLAAYFDRARGVDAGIEVVNEAKVTEERALGLKNKVKFDVCPAEKASEVLEAESIDVLRLLLLCALQAISAASLPLI